MVDGVQWTPVDCDYAGSVGSTPRPIALMILQPTKGFDGSINALAANGDIASRLQFGDSRGHRDDCRRASPAPVAKVEQ